jgi:hypothetical protein
MRTLKLGRQKRLLLISVISWLSFFSLISRGYTAGNSADYTMEYTNNGLSLAATNVPLDVILTDIHEKTGLKLKIHEDHIGRTVSANFKQLDLEQAIKRILRGRNYICFFRSGGELEKVVTIPGSPGGADRERIKKSKELPAGMDQKRRATVEIADLEAMINIGSPLESYNPGEPAGMKLAPAKEDIAQAMQIIDPPVDLRIEEIMEIE